MFCSGADIAIFARTNIGGQAEQGDRFVCCCRNTTAIDESHHSTRTIGNPRPDARRVLKNDGQRIGVMRMQLQLQLLWWWLLLLRRHHPLL
jgi:hypothetical protein